MIDEKQVRLLDEMLGQKTPREVYAKLEKSYRDKREQAEARLAQFSVDYADPLKFLDQCAALAGMLARLHREFDFKNKKSLLQAVFRRIEVEDRQIVGVELNPPFSLFFEDDLKKLFKHPPVAGT